MAISPFGSPFLDRPPGVQTNSPAGHRVDISAATDWNQILLDQEKIQARASLRPEMAASIRAAQDVWLAAHDVQPALIPAQDAETHIEAFITMLVEQASEARRRM